MKYFIIIAVFTVSTLTACVPKKVGEESKYDREILTFAKIAKDVEVDREKAIKTYMGKVVTIRAKIEDIADLREQLLEYYGYRFDPSGFVSVLVCYNKDKALHQIDKSLHIDELFLLDEDSDNSNSYLFRVRIEAIDQMAEPHYYQVWAALTKWSEE